jgi:hypothetical protein
MNLIGGGNTTQTKGREKYSVIQVVPPTPMQASPVPWFQFDDDRPTQRTFFSSLVVFFVQARQAVNFTAKFVAG